MQNELGCPFSIIVGLGNPGRQYQYNRHNIGFRVVDALAQRWGGTWQSKGDGLVATISIHGCPVLLVKPQTFMNSSGQVIAQLAKQKSFELPRLLVIHDELEIPFGQIKLRIGGSHRGHNGLRSIITAVGPDFARLRFGIGRPAQPSLVPDYVLSDFNVADSEEVENLIERSVQLIEDEFKQKTA